MTASTRGGFPRCGGRIGPFGSFIGYLHINIHPTLQPAAGDHTELIPLAIKLMWDVDGVVDVVDQHGAQHPAAAGEEQEVEPVEH